MEHLVVAFKQINDFAKVVDPSRTIETKSEKLKTEGLKNLARSIEITGLIQAVGLRAVGEHVEGQPDRYDVVFGRRRVRAVRDILKQEAISAFVIDPAMSDEDAEMMAIDENMWRSPLGSKEKYAAMARWTALYFSKYPEKREPGKSGGKASAKKREPKVEAETLENKDESNESQNETRSNDPVQEGETTPTPAVEPIPAEAEPKPLAEVIAEATGKSRASVFRDLKVAKKITPEQLEALEPRELPATDYQALANIEDTELRGQAINLVASGMATDAAIAETLKDKDKIEATLTTDQWLVKFCAEILAKLGSNTDAFSRSASYYHETRDARAGFKKATKKAQAKAEAGEAVISKGGFFARYTATLHTVSHPNDWNICPACNGSGRTPAAAEGGMEVQCRTCKGDGFKVKFGG